MSPTPLPIPGHAGAVPDPTEANEQPGPGDFTRPAASVPKPAGFSAGEAAPQEAAPKTIEDRLTLLEKDVSDLKGSSSSESVATLTKKLDDAGLLREQPVKAAASEVDLPEER